VRILGISALRRPQGDPARSERDRVRLPHNARGAALDLPRPAAPAEPCRDPAAVRCPDVEPRAGDREAGAGDV